MKKIWIESKKIILLISIFIMLSMDVCIAEEADTIEKAFKGGKVSGTIGHYFEFTTKDADDSDFGWSTASLTLKYETLSWNRLKFGARFFAHGELFNDHDDGTTDPYESDIETKFTLPEMYLNYGFLENSSVTMGRWKNVGHIDDAQSEGGYISFKEIENLELIAGAMVRFAEIDYDDSEDFGCTNSSQDVDSEVTYGAGSGSNVFFLETIYKPIDLLKLNPYYMYHHDYASVFGIDTNINAEWEEHEVKYGGTIKYVNINADITGREDANVISIQPFVQKGPVKFDFSYSKFAQGDALNHPGWLKDSFSLVDQNLANNNAGAEVFESRIKYSFDRVWLSYAYATANYDTSSTEGEGYSDNEFQVSCNITDDLDVNVRYFIVTFKDIDNTDYNKVETRMRFKF